MHSSLGVKWSWIEGSHGMRAELLGTLTDADLAFSPGGENPTLGALFREIGETEHAYIQSFKTFSLDLSYRSTEAGLEESVAQLAAWYATLDDELKAVVAAFSDEDVAKTIDRSGYATPIDFQLDVYLQALLIFFGKATVYLKAMSKPLTATFREYIG